MTAPRTQAERITALEVQVNRLTTELKSSNEKLDELLALRNKGLGAFWLASSLAGIGAVSIFIQFFNWVKG